MHRLLLFFMLLVLFGGCQSDPQKFRCPNLLQPGHITEQQEWTKKFDPFASPVMGPKIVGDRPSGALDPTPAFQRYQRGTNR